MRGNTLAELKNLESEMNKKSILKMGNFETQVKCLQRYKLVQLQTPWCTCRKEIKDKRLGDDFKNYCGASVSR